MSGSFVGLPLAGACGVRRGAALGLVLGLALGLGGCSGPAPVLYPNRHYQAVGEAAAERDIADCRRLADQAGASSGGGRGEAAAGGAAAGGAIGGAAGAAGGAIAGAPGTGAAIGAASGAAAGLVRSLFRSDGPSQAYRNVVDRCLRERGYEPAGWD
ncbi:MAG TPA: hypothetical protein VFV80_14510 [Geminicoccaceae bacterium]|nr:hypothetical protein [Geminicoccaceae bacterium]